MKKKDALETHFQWIIMGEKKQETDVTRDFYYNAGFPKIYFLYF